MFREIRLAPPSRVSGPGCPVAVVVPVSDVQKATVAVVAVESSDDGMPEVVGGRAVQQLRLELEEEDPLRLQCRIHEVGG